MRSRGFSLIESIAGIFLLTLLIGFVMTVFPNAHRSVELSRDHAQAAWVARSALQQAQVTEYARLVGSSQWTTEVMPGVVHGRTSDLPLQWRTDVEEVEPHLKRVWATVRWQSSSGPKQVVLETMVFDAAGLNSDTQPDGGTGSPSPSPGGTPGQTPTGTPPATPGPTPSTTPGHGSGTGGGNNGNNGNHNGNNGNNGNHNGNNGNNGNHNGNNGNNGNHYGTSGGSHGKPGGGGK